MGAECVEVAGAASGRGGRRGDLVVCERRRRELVEELVEGGLVVAGALERGEVGEEGDELGGVVAGEVVGAIVGEDDSLGALVVDVDVGDGDLGPPELLRGAQRVIPGKHLYRRAVDDDRPELAVRSQAFPDRSTSPLVATDASPPGTVALPAPRPMGSRRRSAIRVRLVGENRLP